MTAERIQKRSSTPRWIAAVAILAAVLPHLSMAAPHTVEELFRERMGRDAAMSPDAARVAIAFRSADSDSDVIAVMETADLGKEDATIHKFTLGKNEKISVQWLSWATSERLLVGIDLYWNPPALSTRKRAWLGSRIYAVNKDGSAPVVLFKNSQPWLASGSNLSRIVERPASDPDHVFMAAWSDVSCDLFKVNIQTGIAEPVERGNRQTFGWETESGQAVLRYDINYNQTIVSLYGRAAAGGEWSLLTRYGQHDDVPDWTYAGDAPGSKLIYIRSAHTADKEGIYLYDIATKTIGDLVASVPDYDMDEAIVIDDKYVGAAYVSDRRSYVFADPSTQKHFDAIDAYFGHTENVYVEAIDSAQTRMLLYVSGPKAPGDYYVYDIARKNPQFLMSARPWLEPDRLASVDVSQIATRDGKTITAYLTWPEGEHSGLPAVIMPHGGPLARDSLQFDPLAQSLAAQGWLVVQPNFRGSSGYGKTFAEAGYRQFSGLMQDDVTDTVLELTRKGVIDSSRVVIFGASYGGYAALAGAVVTPTLYRAAVSLSGVTDLPKMLEWSLAREGRDAHVYQNLVKRIGDPKKDRAALIAASPNRHAAEIQVPVLLIHGKVDNVVPIQQSQMMLKSLQRFGKQVRLIPVVGEGHGGWSPENDILMTNSVIDFLRPHLTAQPAQQH